MLVFRPVAADLIARHASFTFRLNVRSFEMLEVAHQLLGDRQSLPAPAWPALRSIPGRAGDPPVVHAAVLVQAMVLDRHRGLPHPWAHAPKQDRGAVALCRNRSERSNRSPRGRLSPISTTAGAQVAAQAEGCDGAELPKRSAATSRSAGRRGSTLSAWRFFETWTRRRSGGERRSRSRRPRPPRAGGLSGGGGGLMQRPRPRADVREPSDAGRSRVARRRARRPAPDALEREVRVLVQVGHLDLRVDSAGDLTQKADNGVSIERDGNIYKGKPLSPSNGGVANRIGGDLLVRDHGAARCRRSG